MRATAFSNPTINGYKRLNANPLAPKRVLWANDNKGAMCRLVGGMGDAGDSYRESGRRPGSQSISLHGSQIVAGLDGMANKIDPGSPLTDPYAQTQKPLMPRALAKRWTRCPHRPCSGKALGERIHRPLCVCPSSRNRPISVARHGLGTS